jgi:hypothetical protein
MYPQYNNNLKKKEIMEISDLSKSDARALTVSYR